MSAIQLLISLKQTCLEKNKSFQIINTNDDITNAFNISGCAYILGV
jgi:anti-anti-sigma regulatory factor